jgi:Fe-S cluster biosynthesis and repair protein YggX
MSGEGAATIHCVRCGREGPRLARSPLPGALGAEIAARVCGDCWGEWQRAEVMVINELRLNFMDPDALETLNRHMREFLGLDPGGGEGGSGSSA